MTSKNVVFIVLDSLRRDKLSIYNKDVDFTENIAEVAEEATVFEDAVANAPWTLPSHASMFTGMYPWEHEATQKNLSLDVDTPLLAEKFAENNYRSAAFSTNAWLSNKFGLTKGFGQVDNMSATGFSEKLSKIRRMMDEWLAKPGQKRTKRYIVRAGNYLFHYLNTGSQTEEILEKSREFIKEDDGNFFLFMNLMDAHEPYLPPKEYREKHNAPEPEDVCQDPTDYHFGRKQPDFEGLHRIYDASVDYMDDQLGEFFNYLKEQDLWEDTVVVLLSDHGQMLGKNGEYGHQFSVAEPLVSVPLIVNGFEEEKISKQVELRELYNITQDAAGIGENYESGTEYALGGYDFPDMMRPRIPPNKWTEFYQRHRFVRTLDGKIIVSETEEGEENSHFEYGEELSAEEKKKLEKKVDKITYGDSEGETLESKDEEIRQKLEDLGYG